MCRTQYQDVKKMMKKLLLAVAFISILNIQLATAQPQDDPVVMEVGGVQIRKAEFVKDFMFNVGNQTAAKPGVTAEEKRRALQEYTDLYATFRAKVADARSMGMDTSAALLRELDTYRKELAAPYLIDSAELRRLLNEAYERNHYALRAAHILVFCGQSAAPADTLAAYKKAMEARKRVLDGEDFYAVAVDVFKQQRTNAPVNPNEGELGYFTVFNMVYPFENVAYSLKVGEVSMPVRTRFGYHIVKLIDRAELYGNFTLAHIWLRSDNESKRKADIENMYSQLQNGVPFEQVARQSDDYNSRDNGGLMPNSTIGNVPMEYVREVAHLKEGEYTKPFFTQYGWHIVKLVKKDVIPPLEKMEANYKQRMTRDQRGEVSRKLFAADCRKRYGIVDCTVTPVEQPKAKGRKGRKAKVEMMASLDDIVSILSDSVFSARWFYRDSMVSDLRPLVIMPDRQYDTRDLGRYIRRKQIIDNPMPLDMYARKMYEGFLDSVTIVYADSRLEFEHPEFADVVEEYRRGLMIFNYNDQMIWSKAIKDSVGFADFYARESKKKSLDVPSDSIYFWRTRARVTIADIASIGCLDQKKAMKIVKKSFKHNDNSYTLKEKLLAKIDAKNCRIDEPVEMTVDIVEKGRQNLLADNQWERGIWLTPNPDGVGNGAYRIMIVEEILPPMLKEQQEARGYYLNAWQNEVEQNLVRELHKKYNVKINWDVVRSIVY